MNLIKKWRQTKDKEYLKKHYSSPEYLKIYNRPKSKWKLKFQIISRLMKLKKNEKVLDVGCASKMMKPYIEKEGGMYRGLDISEGFRPDYVGDAENMSMIQDNEFDWVILSDILEHLPCPKKALEESYRIGKKAIIVVPNWYRLERLKFLPRDPNDRHINRKSPKKWIEDLKRIGFKIIKLRGFYYVPSIAFYPVMPLTVIDLFFRIVFEKVSKIIDNNLSEMPLIRFLGQELIIIAIKTEQ